MQNGRIEKITQGFTLIELLVVLSIVALLLTLVSPKYFSHIDRAKETALKQDLQIMRIAIDQYFGDHGFYPDNLEILVKESYLDKIPVDPITEKIDSWVIIRPEPPLRGGVYDIKSSADGVAKDGTAFNNW
jgi:general secretion pathway protein G